MAGSSPAMTKNEHAMALERRLAAGLNRGQARAVRRWLSNIALTLQA
jgi:hypothetical protein